MKKGLALLLFSCVLNSCNPLTSSPDNNSTVTTPNNITTTSPDSVSSPSTNPSSSPEKPVTSPSGSKPSTSETTPPVNPTSPIIPTTPTPITSSGGDKEDYVLIPSSKGKLYVRKEASEYYSSINFSQGKQQLKTAISKKISSNFTSISYSGLWSAFKETDFDSRGNIMDMYSDITCNKQCGTYKVEGDCYNREHSVPKSWFSEAKPAYSDLFHLYPTDGKVNGMRSNFAFGEVASATYVSHNGSKLGSGKSEFGYTGKVFEPIDEYKGDFARTYYYFATRYEGLAKTSGDGAQHFTSQAFPGLTTYSLKLFAKWDALDPISEKEIKRNQVIYKSYQHNRNPFIDIPGLAEYIWG